MGTLAEAVLAALRGFASEVGTWTNQGTLVSIEGHIAQVESAVVQDVHAGETAAKAVLADLYGAFHGHTPAEAPAPAAPVVTPVPGAATATATVPTPVQTVTVPAEPVVAPVAADPTPAPSTTTEASSAPSSTPSASTETAAPAAPTA